MSTLHGHTSNSRPTRRFWGETVRAERTLSRSWRSQAWETGVWPRGAQVRRTVGCSMNPLSSIRTMGLPVAADFF